MVRLLIVEDGDVWPEVAELDYKRYGWETVIVKDGLQGKEALTAGKFDAVVLDRHMPNLNGDELLVWIRSQSTLQDLCVVMVTAYWNETETAVEAMKLKAFHYLRKPFDVGPLHGILCAGIAWHRTHALRRGLLASFEKTALFGKVRGILSDAVGVDGVHAVFVNENGEIETVLGAPLDQSTAGPRTFVDRILKGEAIIFGNTVAAVAALEPVIAGAGTLMAVPVRGASQVEGVLEMESLKEGAFDSTWDDVLGYLADLIGVALHIGKQAEAARQIEIQKVENERISKLYQELRHNVATPAQIIGMQARELESDWAKPAAVRDEAKIVERLGYIRDNVDIVEAAMDGLREISAPLPPLVKKNFDLAELLRRCAGEIGEHQGITIAVPCESRHEIEADSRKLRYCFDCLLNNAVEAIQADREQSWDAPKERLDAVSVGIEEGPDEICVSIEDTGIGFDPNEADILFQPAYSTKTKHPDGGDGPRVLRGADRVTRLLSLMTAYSQTPRLKEKLDHLAPQQAHVLIEDGESVVMRVGSGPVGGIVWKEPEAVDTGDRLGPDAASRGFGLYSVKRIIMEHGGSIDARPVEPHGAIFTVRLPKVG